MTISADYAPNIDLGNGTTTSFAMNFPFGAQDDLLVSLFDTVANADVSPAPVLNGSGTYDYTISGTPDSDTGIYPNGTITFNTAPPSTCKVVRERVTPKRQNTSLTNNGPFPAKTVEGAFDRAEMQNQEAAEFQSRAVVAPASAQTISMEIPPAFFAGGKLLTYDVAQKKLSADDPDVAGMETAIAEAEAVLAEIDAALGALGSQAVDFARPSDAYLNAPAGSEADGYRALVGKAPTGTFAGKMGQIAQKISGTWYFSGTPKAGQRIYDIASGLFWVQRNGWWNKVKPGFTGYQDFADVPDGTAANGLTIGTGQVISLGGATGSLVNNSRIENSGNMYTVLPLHGKHVKLGMRARHKAGHTTGNGLTLATGTYVGGAIITKMGSHCAFEYASAPVVSIWGGPRRLVLGGVPQAYEIEPNLQFQYSSVDTNLPVHGVGADVIVESMVSGNSIRAWADSGHWANSYTDDMVSALLGDNDSGDLGYIYFQSGPNEDANNPYIYEIWWTELDTPQEALPDPKQLPDSAGLPTFALADIAFGSATEILRYTTTDGGLANMFDIDIAVHSASSVTGYAATLQKWRCGGGQFAGDVHASTPAQIGSEHVMSENPSVIALSGTLTQAIDGDDIVIKYNPSRSGSDATSYSPHVRATLYSRGEPVPVVT